MDQNIDDSSRTMLILSNQILTSILAVKKNMYYKGCTE